MTISATTQGLRPGVCTSTSRPSTPFTGQLIFETDTNRLAVWNGTSWVVLADADTPPGLELVKTQTIGTTVTSVEVTNAFSATYDNYKVVISGVDSSASGDFLFFTFGSASTGYYGSLGYDRPSGAGSGYYRRNNGANLYFALTDNDDATNLVCDIINPFASKRSSIMGQGYGGDYMYWFSGLLANTTSYSSFTITRNGTNTFTGGEIRVYGYRNS